jgi:hypothetical protein
MKRWLAPSQMVFLMESVFDPIPCSRSTQFSVVASSELLAKKGTPFLGKISAIFTHRTSGDDSGSLCMYLQEYKLLSQLGDEQSSAVPDEQPGELVLLENEILFQGTLLNWVLDDITVVDSIPLFNQSSSNRRYLCRFGMEDQHLRPLRYNFTSTVLELISFPYLVSKELATIAS